MSRGNNQQQAQQNNQQGQRQAHNQQSQQGQHQQQNNQQSQQLNGNGGKSKLHARFVTRLWTGRVMKIACIAGLFSALGVFALDTWYTGKPLEPYSGLIGGLAIGILTTMIEIVGNLILFDEQWSQLFKYDFGDKSGSMLIALYLLGYIGDIGTNAIGLYEQYLLSGHPVTYVTYMVIAFGAVFLGMAELLIQISLVGIGIFTVYEKEANEWINANFPKKQNDILRMLGMK